jgi:PRC-barrel domain
MIQAARWPSLGLSIIAAGLSLTNVPSREFTATANAAAVAAFPPPRGTPGALGSGSARQIAALKIPAPSAHSEPAAPANLVPLNARDCTGILGKKIMGPDHEELGLLVDVLIDARGRPRAALIDFGGFLGVGSRKIAVDWKLLQLTPGQPDWKISLNLGRAEIQGAPEYKPDAATNKIVGRPPKLSPPPQAGK